MFPMEDEPADLEPFNRLSELKRRNTMCLPHMRSFYALENLQQPRDDFHPGLSLHQERARLKEGKYTQ